MEMLGFLNIFFFWLFLIVMRFLKLIIIILNLIVILKDTL